jgi:hypothetical protein
MKKELAEERDKVLKGIKDAKNTIIRLNKPGRFAKEETDELQQITTLLNSVECLDLDDNPIMPLRHSDINALMIKKGSLSDNERMQVQAHVEYTYHILKSLPWPDHLQEIPRIAFFHHERLDGSGYPIGAVSSDISLSGRILGVADIYDALTASDRSYKKKDTSERAMEIIKNEAKDGKLDSEVVRIFQEIISRTE